MFNHNYKDIITIDNLIATWRKFLLGKRHKKDVANFELHLAENICRLQRELANKTYIHGGYSAFNVSDPKPRNIHKASVRDRVIHHLIYETLYQYFDLRFIYDSYSCRKNKGTHKAFKRFDLFARQVSKNHTRTCFVLKCDIKKFFANIDQVILNNILKRHIADLDILWLIKQITSSFFSFRFGVGLPLGNLTSQLLVNIYMHEFDMYIKQELRVKCYIRYADDFVILSDRKEYLEKLILEIRIFLNEKLNLSLHENKVYIKTYASGVDFLGWVHFPYYRRLRTTTKKRILRNIRWYPKSETLNSYLGLLKHGNTIKIKRKIANRIYLSNSF